VFWSPQVQHAQSPNLQKKGCRVPIFISYSHADSAFVDVLAKNLVFHRHHVWLDRWELNVGDSLIGKIQGALTESSAILVILSKTSVKSEWCKKELSVALTRELAEKQALVLPCVIDDCKVPLFLRDKQHADFRKDPDKAFNEVSNALLRITNRQTGRIESPNFHTDFAVDWKKGRATGLWYFDWTFVDHGEKIEYCVLSRCQMACNEAATLKFQKLSKDGRQDYIRKAFSRVVRHVKKAKLKIRLEDEFEKVKLFELRGTGKERWLVEITSRRMGIDNGKDTLVHVDQVFERTLRHATPERKKK
jgi:hypothetical protein